MELKDYITISISVFTLIINVFFYIIIAPKINFKFKSKEKLYNLVSEYLEYLVLVSSSENFDGVPTKIRSYSIKIQLMFNEGKAPLDLRNALEDVFQLIKFRKDSNGDIDIDEWKDEMKETILKIRELFSKYKNKIKW